MSLGSSTAVAVDGVDVHPQRLIPVSRAQSREPAADGDKQQHIKQQHHSQTAQHDSFAESSSPAVVKQVTAAGGWEQVTVAETAAKKRKPDAVGVGSGLFSYRSLRFQVCGLAAGLEAVSFYFCPILATDFCCCNSLRSWSLLLVVVSYSYSDGSNLTKRCCE